MSMINTGARAKKKHVGVFFRLLSKISMKVKKFCVKM